MPAEAPQALWSWRKAYLFLSAWLVGAEFPEVVEAPQDTRAKEINRSARNKDRFFLKICTSE